MATAKQIDQQGEEAKKLYESIASSAKNYNERRKDKTEELKGLLAPIWAALADGKTVNGCKNKVEWAKWVNPTAKHPERYFYLVMNDKKGLKSLQSKREKRESSFVALKKLHEIEVDGTRYWISSIAVKEDSARTANGNRKATVTLDVVLVETHAMEDDGPLCKPPSQRRKWFKSDQYVYAAKGEEPTCKTCLHAIEYKAAKAKAIAAAA
ncbi:MAG: hypothetical protein WA639_10830 [Candidatus Acidiferrum sp.]